MSKSLSLKLPIAVAVILLVAGYAGLEAWPERMEPAGFGVIRINNEVITEDVLEVGDSPIEVPSSSTLDTLDWRLYQSEEFGFEIKYPPALSGLERTYNSEGIVGGINFRLPSQGQSDPSEPYQFNARRFFTDWITDPCAPHPAGVQTDELIGGFSFTKSEARNSDVTLSSIIHIGRHNGVCYRLSYFDRLDGGPVSAANVARFEQIVSTFRLIDPDR